MILKFKVVGVIPKHAKTYEGACKSAIKSSGADFSVGYREIVGGRFTVFVAYVIECGNLTGKPLMDLVVHKWKAGGKKPYGEFTFII